jgi:4-hydroxythreonine-4-phosphate dehydrogenase
MIRVSQGHEHSIGTEVFLKSFCLLPPKDQSKFIFYTSKKNLENNFKHLGINFSIVDENLFFQESSLKLKLITNTSQCSQTMTSLEDALNDIKEKDALVTLPSSKDQFQIKGKTFSGHTEYFREKYNNSFLNMVFQFDSIYLLLISDHIPLNKVPATITSELIESKVSNLLLNLLNIETVNLAGINPHGGENGLLGSEDEQIKNAILNLSKKFKAVNFFGPLAGDSFLMNPKANSLYVSMFHDQGLSSFKSLFNLYGVHLTFGLPFVRLSVDHGTAFELYGKNQADYMGSYQVLQEALKYQAQV